MSGGLESLWPTHPAFPSAFGSIQDARAFCETFFAYYNHEHRHSGIDLHTPASVHYGTATEVRADRARTLNAAYTANPDRFRGRPPTHPSSPPSPGSTTLTRSTHTEQVTRSCLKVLDRLWCGRTLRE